MRLRRLAWRIPHPATATEGWLEGKPSKEELAAVYEAARQARKNWKPDKEAWKQLVELHAFVGKHVRLQFWDPCMQLLEDEGPNPLIADCRGIVTLLEDGFLQPFLLVENERDRPTVNGYSAVQCLVERPGVALRLAPIAELLEIEEVTDAQVEREERENAPRQNRVTPLGDLIRTRARGTLMGNRGCLHDSDREITHPFLKSYIAWKACTTNTKGPKRQVMKPGSYTELFFLDEATALAAGHRPCSQCRRTRYDKFVEAWKRGNPDRCGGSTWDIAVLDAAVHSERLDQGQHKVTYTASLDDLPDGTFILWPPGSNEAPVLVRGDRLLVWTPGGYGYFSRERPKGTQVSVVTPRSIVNALSAGYEPEHLPDLANITKIDESVLADFLAEKPNDSAEEWIDRMFLRAHRTWKG